MLAPFIILIFMGLMSDMEARKQSKRVTGETLAAYRKLRIFAPVTLGTVILYLNS